jgi:hypothetical protein
MRIKYQTVEDDYVAFNVFFSRHSPLAKLVMSQALYFHDWAAAVFGVVILGGLSVWILAGNSRRMGRIARNLFREGKNKGFLGVRELEINDYGLLAKSEYSEGKIAWTMIERIGSTPDYTFIFTGATKAIILPKARVTEGDYDAFVAELTSRVAQSAATASTGKESTFIDSSPVSCEDRRAGRHSGYGIASFVIALASIGAIFLSFIAVIIIAMIVEGAVERNNPLFVIFAIGFFLAWGAAFVGAGLGIAGLLSKNRKKPFAVVGLILNLLIIFSVVLMILARSHS